ncbi:Endoplasmic reticulum membrane-associated oxidoreductin involved in disulfide bond formation [Trachipleistophora hominis]|uniref:Endoplasmic reticulum membrane-associated oxidoreductin involved in disulfide bond formation n=1 Tax=Trachipleistophora hominis TaxID=72359 RepID=L7JUY1_TRAHO|nr:Endoplasmic reticulum membrane-associated oxidoreductin involved in disulfide bond formation [Trachipleistophora hominis]
MILAVFIPMIFARLLLRNKSDFRRQLNEICKHRAFSRIEMDFSNTCLFPELMKECKLWECLFSEAGNLKRIEKNGESRMIVDLLLNPESYTGYKKGSSEIWEKLKGINDSELYKIMLSGIHQSVNIHKAAFYKPCGYNFLKNVMLFRKTCRNDAFIGNFKILRLFLLTSLKKLELAENIKYKWLEGLKSCVLIEIPLFPHIKRLSKDLEDAIDILSCMPCPKCRLWSTIQFKGLGVAAKIIAGEKISQQDLVFFINFLNRICVADTEFDVMEDMLSNYYWHIFLLYKKNFLRCAWPYYCFWLYWSTKQLIIKILF